MGIYVESHPRPDQYRLHSPFKDNKPGMNRGADFSNYNHNKYGVDLTWGNAEGILEMLELMAKRDGFGNVLADGVKVAAEKIEKNAAEFAYHMHNNAWAVICPPEWLEAYHWDPETTEPDPEHLKDLAISELAKELGLI